MEERGRRGVSLSASPRPPLPASPPHPGKRGGTEGGAPLQGGNSHTAEAASRPPGELRV